MRWTVDLGNTPRTSEKTPRKLDVPGKRETSTSQRKSSELTSTTSKSNNRKRKRNESRNDDLQNVEQNEKLRFIVSAAIEDQISRNFRANRSSAVQSPPLDNEREFKKMRTVNELELRGLQIQKAMISDEDGDRQLHVAVAYEDLKLVQMLCSLMHKSGISLDLINCLRQTPLHLAVIVGNVKIAKVLVIFGASSSMKDRNGNSVIHLAVKNFQLEMLNFLLTLPGLTGVLDSMDNEGYSALYYAVMKNDAAAVQSLCNNGADINITDGKSGRSCLIHSILAKNCKMVKLLLKFGACAEKSDYSGRTALDLAIEKPDSTIIRLLDKAKMAAGSPLKTINTEDIAIHVSSTSPQSLGRIESDSKRIIKRTKQGTDRKSVKVYQSTKSSKQ